MNIYDLLFRDYFDNRGRDKYLLGEKFEFEWIDYFLALNNV